MDKLEADDLAAFNRAWLIASSRISNISPYTIESTLSRWVAWNHSRSNSKDLSYRPPQTDTKPLAPNHIPKS